MKHYVLLKFKPGYFNDEILAYTKSVFGKIGRLDDIEVVKVCSNCIDRDLNMDIMIEMKVSDEKSLESYLNHELHISFVNTVNNHLISKVSFDCEY